MDYTAAFAISAAGMTLERTRVEVATLNLANAHTTQAAAETPYRAMRVVARAGVTDSSFAAALDAAEGSAASPALLLPSVTVEPLNAAPRKVHEPGHPLADDRGFVTNPAVDAAAEMVTLMSATRAYEANVAAMNASRTLALKALDIGGTT